MMIDMLLMKTQNRPISQQDCCILAINNCIELAISQYPLSSSEREMMIWTSDNENFDFYGQETLMRHVLFNLLKNALYFTKAKDQGQIRFSTNCTSEFNELHIYDTGLGIDPVKLPLIFDEHYSTTSEGAGLGLSFCRQYMENIGGTITCQSEKDHYTEFVLRFPPIDPRT